MRKIEEIEQQIRGLTPEEFVELRDWVLQQDWNAWDSKIGSDAAAGKFDALVAEARVEYESGKARKL